MRMRTTPLLDRYGLAMILILALVLRICAAFFTHFNPYVWDSHVYMGMADDILNDNSRSGFPYGYPLLIAIVKTLCPGRLTTGALLALNVLLSTAVVWMVYQIGDATTASTKFSRLTSLAVAVYPHQIHYTRLVMTEVLCTFLLTLAVLLLLRSDEAWPSETAFGQQFAAGLLFCVASAVRPSVALVAPLLLVVGWIMGKPRKWLAALLGGFLVGVAVFTLAERIAIVRPPLTVANNALISIQSDSRYVQFQEFPPDEQSRALQTYLGFAAHHPGTFLQQRAISLWELWGPWSLPGNKPENRTAAVRFVVATRFLLLALALAAAWRQRRRYQTWVLLSPIIVLTVVHMASFSNHRFICPIEPMLFILAAMSVRDRASKRRRESPAPVLTEEKIALVGAG